MTRKRLVEPPRTKADAWPIQFHQLEALLRTLGEEDDLSEEAKLEVAQEFLSRCRDVDSFTNEEISAAMGMTRTASQRPERSGLIKIRDRRALEDFR